MTLPTPAADRLAAKVKAARDLGLWGVELTTQEADTLLAEIARLREQETPEPCGAALPDDHRFGPCTRVDGHEWHRDATGASWIESAADMQRRVRS